MMAIVRHIKQCMSNPFETEGHPPELINIASGLIATQEIQESLITSLVGILRTLPDMNLGPALCMVYPQQTPNLL